MNTAAKFRLPAPPVTDDVEEEKPPPIPLPPPPFPEALPPKAARKSQKRLSKKENAAMQIKTSDGAAEREGTIEIQGRTFKTALPPVPEFFPVPKTWPSIRKGKARMHSQFLVKDPAVAPLGERFCVRQVAPKEHRQRRDSAPVVRSPSLAPIDTGEGGESSEEEETPTASAQPEQLINQAMEGMRELIGQAIKTSDFAVSSKLREHMQKLKKLRPVASKAERESEKLVVFDTIVSVLQEARKLMAP